MFNNNSMNHVVVLCVVCLFVVVYISSREVYNSISHLPCIATRDICIDEI